MLFSVTALSLLGFYMGFTAYMGEGGDIVVVYGGKSPTLFTGLVPVYLSEKIGALNRVSASSPEAVAPCTLKGESIFVRGIVPEDFVNLKKLIMVEGSMLELDDVNSVIVVRNAAVRLSIKPGGEILILGVLTDRYLELQVKGIYE